MSVFHGRCSNCDAVPSPSLAPLWHLYCTGNMIQHCIVFVHKRLPQRAKLAQAIIVYCSAKAAHRQASVRFEAQVSPNQRGEHANVGKCIHNRMLSQGAACAVYHVVAVASVCSRSVPPNS